jgi:hypothetical protein
MRTAERIIDGLTVIALGFIFLGSTLGYFPWSVGTTVLALLSLWPVLLVTIGLDIVGHGLNSPWLRVVSSAIALIAVLYGGLVLPATQSQTRFLGFLGSALGSSRSFSHSTDTGNITDATIVIKGGTGEIDIGAGERGTLVAVSGESPFDNPAFSVSRSATRADVLASLGTGTAIWPFSGRSQMDLKLCPVVTWDIQLETGASSLVADLKDVPVKALLLKTGASTSDVSLGPIPSDEGEVSVRVESGVSSVTLRVPTGVEVRVEAQTGLSSVSVPSDLTRLSGSGRVYESAGYQGARRRYLVRIQTGLGSVDVRRY